MNRRRAVNGFMTSILWTSAAFLVLLLLAVLLYVGVNGWSALSWEFLTEPPRDSMTRGGISTPLVGTMQLVLVSMFFARAREGGDAPFLSRKVDRVWQALSWNEVAEVLSEEGDPVDSAAVRKRFERVKEKLAKLAKAEGLI